MPAFLYTTGCLGASTHDLESRPMLTTSKAYGLTSRRNVVIGTSLKGQPYEKNHPGLENSERKSLNISMIEPPSTGDNMFSWWRMSSPVNGLWEILNCALVNIQYFLFSTSSICLMSSFNLSPTSIYSYLFSSIATIMSRSRVQWDGSGGQSPCLESLTAWVWLSSHVFLFLYCSYCF